MESRPDRPNLSLVVAPTEPIEPPTRHEGSATDPVPTDLLGEMAAARRRVRDRLGAAGHAAYSATVREHYGDKPDNVSQEPGTVTHVNFTSRTREPNPDGSPPKPGA